MSDKLLIDKQLVIDCRAVVAEWGPHSYAELLSRIDGALSEQFTAADDTPSKSRMARVAAIQDFVGAPNADVDAPEPHVAQPAAQGGPVAYLVSPNAHAHPKASEELVFDKPDDRPDWRVFPLYTHLPQQQARVTVTDEIADLAETIFLRAWTNADTRRKAMRAALEAVADQLAGGGE